MARRPDLDLSGQWRAAPAADEGLRLRYVDDDLDDSGWERLPVPGHWRSSPAFASCEGPVLYRTRFTEDALPEPADLDGRRAFLVLDGVLAASDVWLDGTYLGDTSGYVSPHAFEITDLLRARGDHLLAMEVANGPVGAGRTRDLTGALGRSALIGTPHNPGGIWRPVKVTRTGPVRLRYSRLRCPTAGPPAPCSPCAPCSTPKRPGPSRCARRCDWPSMRRGTRCPARRPRWWSSASTRWPPGRTGSSGRSACPTPSSGGPAPSAANRATTSPSRPSSTTW